MANRIVLPHLTPKEVKERDFAEHNFHKDLASCWSGDDFDKERAYKLVIGHAVEIFKVVYDNYRNKPAFLEDWFEEIEQEAVFRTLTVFVNVTTYGMPPLEQLERNMQAAIRDYRATLVIPKIRFIPPSPEDPPLLKMAKNAARLLTAPNPVAVRRKEFVLPRLAEKGWDVTTWAAKAKVSRHTAKNYLEAKRKTYHDSLKKLADALGVSFQEFPK